MRRLSALCCLLSVLTACQSPRLVESTTHLKPAPAAAAGIPQPVRPAFMPPPPVASPRVTLFSLQVSNAPVQDVLVNLARDAKVNIDIHPGIEGTVTLSAIRQSLPQLLERVANQVDMRWRLAGETLVVEPDRPYLHTYSVDYVALERETESEIGVLTSVVKSDAGEASASGNSSTTRIKTKSKNAFWGSLLKNLEDLLRREDEKIIVETVIRSGGDELVRGKSSTSGTSKTDTQTDGTKKDGTPTSTQRTVRGDTDLRQSSASERNKGASVEQTTQESKTVRIIGNTESGVLAVRGTGRQHAMITDFLSKVGNSARRQVMIEATIVEVALSREFETGVDWSRIRNGGQGGQGFQNLGGTIPQSTAEGGGFPFPSVIGQNPVSLFLFQNGSVNVAVKLLEMFGKTRVLSSPKLMALNNQMALLKVVRDVPYFTLKVTRTKNGLNMPDTVDYESKLHTVPEGIMMSVLPQISATGQISLNVRPTITHITGYISDPAVALALAGNSTAQSLVPKVEVREMESTLRLSSGEIGVLGGLIQDSISDQSDGLPGLGMIPGLGRLFSHKTDTSKKTELVVFLRPTVVNDPSLNGDLSAFRDHLPSNGFFDRRDGYRQVGGGMTE